MERQIARRSTAFGERRQRHLADRRLGRSPLEGRSDEFLGAEPHRGGEVGHLPLVLTVIVHERLHRDGVFLRVSPPPVLARRDQPADHRADVRRRGPGAHHRVQHDGGGADVGVEEPQQIRIVQLLDVSGARLRQDRVVHPPAQLGQARRGSAVPRHRVVQVGERKHRHAVEILIQPVDVRVLSAAAIDEDLDGECLPRGVGRPPSLVDRLFLAHLAFEIVVSPPHRVGVDGVVQFCRGLVDAEHVAREERRHGLALAGPEREAAGRALELLQLLQRALDARAQIAHVDAREAERIAEISGHREYQCARRALLDAAERILDDVARAFAEPDQRGRRELDMQTADTRHHAGRQFKGLLRIGRCLSVSRDALRRDRHLDWDDLFERIALVAQLHRRLDPGTAGRPGDHVEAHFGGAAGGHRYRLLPIAPDLDDVGIQALHRDDGSAWLLQLAGDDRPEERLVAPRHEPRECGLQHDRLVDPDFAFPRSEPGRLVAGNRHDAVGRQRFGQLHVSRGAAARVGGDRAEPEREHPEVLAQLADSRIGAAAAAVVGALRRQHAPADDALTVVCGHHLERLRDVDRAQDVGRPERGERQHAVVDGPQRHLSGRRRAGGVGDLKIDLRRPGRPKLVAVRFDGQRQPLRRIVDGQLRVAEAEGRLARIARVGGLHLGLRSPLHEEH